MTSPRRDAYLGLRNLVLSLTRETLQLREVYTSDNLLGVVMDESLNSGQVYTLVAWIHGETSMYFSTGGGFIGAGHYPAPRKAARELLAFAANTYRDAAHKVPLTPLPLPGALNAYFVTDNGIYATSASMKAIADRTDPLTPLYMKAKNLITAIRLQSHTLQE